MIEDREFEGKDLEEALNEAAAALGISHDELHYEMVEQGRRGLLGMGVKAVRIRVKPPIEAELPLGPPQDAATPGPPAARRRKSKPRAKTKAQPSADPVQTEDVETTLRRILELMGLELDVRIEAGDGGINIHLEGPDRKLLLTKDAELLSSIQFLLNRMSRRTWPDVGRIHVCCDGQSRPRDDELIDLARKVAKQVSKTGRTRKLRPMNAYERRLVHLEVREFAGLTSSSDGNGALKRVRISKVQNQI
jgi:spoIIIJ-associated protein